MRGHIIAARTRVGIRSVSAAQAFSRMAWQEEGDKMLSLESRCMWWERAVGAGSTEQDHWARLRSRA